MIKRLWHGCFHIGPISIPRSITALGYASGSYRHSGLIYGPVYQTHVACRTPSIQSWNKHVSTWSGVYYASLHSHNTLQSVLKRNCTPTYIAKKYEKQTAAIYSETVTWADRIQSGHDFLCKKMFHVKAVLHSLLLQMVWKPRNKLV